MSIALLAHSLKRLAVFSQVPEASLRHELPRIEEIIHVIQWALYGEALQPEEADRFDSSETLLVKNRLLLGRAIAAEEALARRGEGG